MMHLGEEDVRAVLRWDALIPAMEAALAAFSTGRVMQPVRNMMTIEEGRRYLGVMPAVMALKESGDVILSKARIHAEAGEIFAGMASVPASATTVFKSVGIAVEDLATARLVYDAVRARSPGAT